MTDAMLVLHGVAIKKHGTASEVAELLQLDADAVAAALNTAAQNGRVVQAKGKYSLAPAARVALKSGYSAMFAEQRGDQAFVAAYDRFEAINTELKQVITDWQVMEVGGKSVTNDHSDQAYDQAVIDRLGDVHERVEPVLEQLAQSLPRLSRYQQRLLAALERAEDGEIAWVSGASLGSYHTVWFELHEDLLRITGNVRSD